MTSFDDLDFSPASTPSSNGVHLPHETTVPNPAAGGVAADQILPRSTDLSPDESPPQSRPQLPPVGRARISMVREAQAVQTTEVELADVLLKIQSGEWRAQVTKVRRAYEKGGKDAATPLKLKLPGVLFSGTFSKRANTCLLAHSGLICVDLDELGPQLEGIRDLIAQDPHTLAAFLSPTGTGLKVVFRCDPAKEHIANFRAAKWYVARHFGLQVDEACKDVARLCFISDDPDAFIADSAQPLPTPTEPQQFKAPDERLPGSALIGDKPGDDYDRKADVAQLLQRHNWTKSGRNGWIRPGKTQGISATLDALNGLPNRFYVFSSNAQPFEADHTYRPWHVYALLEHGGDFKKASQALYKDGYGARVESLQAPIGTQSTPQSSSAPIQTPKPERIEELRTILKSRAFDITKPLPKPREIYSIAGTRICTPGNLTTIYSQAKTGKSSLVGAMLAATFTNPASSHDTLQVSGPNYGNHAVLHFDTEQSPYDWQQLVLTSLRRVDLADPPEWLLSHSLTGLPVLDAKQSVEQCIRDAHARFGGIHSIIIDGVADLVIDPNDPAECFPLVTRLHALAIEFDTAIISILHMNPGSEVKGRGHLGSQLERKSESNLTLTKDGDVSMVSSTKQRGKSIPADKAPSFRWSDERQMHVSTKTPESAKKSKPGRVEIYPFADFSTVLPSKTDQPLPLNQITARCAVNKPIKSNQMFNVLKRWEEDGFIAITDSPKGKLYRKRV